LLKRIKRIENVGNFTEFTRGGAIGFEELTLIFGFNSCGKSTLSDVLRSMSLNDSQVIQSRKTLGVEEDQLQKIVLSLYNDECEITVNYDDEEWNLSGDCNYNIEVFDTKFIDKNVFTGLSINRDNKENITDFVLGEANVKLAKKISNLNEKKGKVKSNKKDIFEKIEKRLKKNNFKISVEEFVNKNIRNDMTNIDLTIKNLKHELKKLNKLSEKIGEISEKKTPNKTKFKINVMSIINNTNNLLEKSFDDLNAEACNKVNKHIENNFKNLNGEEESWIKKGTFEYVNMEQSNCPFCGQTLEEDSKKLIELYKKYFSESYQEFAHNIENQLESKKENLQESISFLKSFPRDNLELLKEYIELIDDEECKTKVKALEKLANNIDEKLNEARIKINEILNSFKEKIELKINNPYKELTSINSSEIKSKIKIIKKLIIQFQEEEIELKQHVKDFKNEIKEKNIESELKEIKTGIKKMKLKKLRKKAESICEEYKSVISNFEEIKQNVKEKENKLEQNREEFLEEYFSKINHYFKYFGSRCFKVEQSFSRRGHKPVIRMEIKYKGESIKTNDLKHVFSDSDRRALAMSVFCAKLELLEEEELKNTIIVMDDPVTSFDDNRTSSTINYLHELVNKSRQLIIFSHYAPFIKKFVQSTSSDLPYSLLEVHKKSETSCIREIDEKEFLLNPHEKAFEKIFNFIKREHDSDISKKLRVFLENEIKMRFKKQIYDMGLNDSSLNNLILSLEEAGHIDNKAKNKLITFKNTLNPDHHRHEMTHKEDVRSFAERMLEYIYFNLSPNS
jgi:wobble nucleotide-excising tRNase